MKYYLDSSSLEVLQELRSEVVDNINSRALTPAIKNELVIRFNVWLDTTAQSIYATGVSLPGADTMPPVDPGIDANLVFN
jgi:hypothetical protein